jgi:hypothetical protein
MTNETDSMPQFSSPARISLLKVRQASLVAELELLTDTATHHSASLIYTLTPYADQKHSFCISSSQFRRVLSSFVDFLLTTHRVSIIFAGKGTILVSSCVISSPSLMPGPPHRERVYVLHWAGSFDRPTSGASRDMAQKRTKLFWGIPRPPMIPIAIERRVPSFRLTSQTTIILSCQMRTQTISTTTRSCRSL